jgi:hypothetical protein
MNNKLMSNYRDNVIKQCIKLVAQYIRLKTFCYNAIPHPNIRKQTRQIPKHLNEHQPKKPSLNPTKHPKIKQLMLIAKKEIKIKNH